MHGNGSNQRFRKSRKIKLGDLAIGGGAPISVQSMARSPTVAVDEVLAEIREMAIAGADIVRVAVVREDCINGLKKIVERSPVPIVADVHYPMDLAAKAVNAGVAGVRINPLMPGDFKSFNALIGALKNSKAAVRVGVNAGGLPPGETVDIKRMLTPLWNTVERLADGGVVNIKVSAKSAHVTINEKLNRALAKRGSWPIHLGFTEAGRGVSGIVRSTVALAPLLSEGIGDTIRVSLSGSPIEEIKVAVNLLQVLGLKKEGVHIIACPMCGRCHGEVAQTVQYVEEELRSCERALTVAVMGCEINGPGEASRADFGIAAGPEGWVLFSRGEVLEMCNREEGPVRLVEEALKESAVVEHVNESEGSKRSTKK